MPCAISRLSVVDFEGVDRRWCDHLEDFHPHIARAHRLEAHLGLEHRDRPFEEVFFLAGVEAPGLDVFDALPAVGLVDTYIDLRSEEHTSELQSLMRISYAVFCLKKKQKSSPQYTIQHT